MLWKKNIRKDYMKIGLSLIAFSERVSTDFIKMSHSLQIHDFEIPFGNYDYSDGKFERNEIFSVHASKDMLEKDEKEFFKELFRLKDFCEKCNCNRIVFHPNSNNERNELYFALLNMYFLDYHICIENTSENLDDLIPLISKYQFNITWDIAHAVYHNHYVWDKVAKIEYFHIRGFSENKRYVSLMKTEKSNDVPIKDNAVYILEYPYGNMYELLMDWKLLKKMLMSS